MASSLVLVATTDRELDRRIGIILAALGHPAQFTSDSVEALSLLLGPNPPEVALLDARLPGHAGLEIAAEIKRRSHTGQSWIILLTRAVDASSIAMAADAGVDDVLLCDSEFEADLRVRLGVGVRMREMSFQRETGWGASKTGWDAGMRAARDRLTGLWNRDSLLAMLFPETDRVQRIGTPLSLLLLDLDHFGRINAKYGCEAGDAILQELAARLRRYLRSYDLLGRSGEDEFLIALPGCNAAQALHLASRIRAMLLHRPFAAGRDLVSISGSIGLAQSRGRSPLVALRDAERALSAAKAAGRNCEREYPAPSEAAAIQ